MTAERRKPTYRFPDLTGRNVPYNGRRLKPTEIGEDGIDCFFSDSGKYILWNGMYNAWIALVDVLEDGTFKGTLNAHVGLSWQYPTMREAVKGLDKKMDWYLRSIL